MHSVLTSPDCKPFSLLHVGTLATFPRCTLIILRWPILTCLYKKMCFVCFISQSGFVLAVAETHCVNQAYPPRVTNLTLLKQPWPCLARTGGWWDRLRPLEPLLLWGLDASLRVCAVPFVLRMKWDGLFSLLAAHIRDWRPFQNQHMPEKACG